jgi:hypothetical protein
LAGKVRAGGHGILDGVLKKTQVITTFGFLPWGRWRDKNEGREADKIGIIGVDTEGNRIGGVCEPTTFE